MFKPQDITTFFGRVAPKFPHFPEFAAEFDEASKNRTSDHDKRFETMIAVVGKEQFIQLTNMIFSSEKNTKLFEEEWKKKFGSYAHAPVHEVKHAVLAREAMTAINNNDPVAFKAWSEEIKKVVINKDGVMCEHPLLKLVTAQPIRFKEQCVFLQELAVAELNGKDPNKEFHITNKYNCKAISGYQQLHLPKEKENAIQQAKSQIQNAPWRYFEYTKDMAYAEIAQAAGASGGNPAPKGP